MLGRVALITGASRGIGRSVALSLARQGVKVVLASKSTRRGSDTPPLAGTLEDVAAEVRRAGGAALVVPMDARDPAQVQRAVEAAIAWHGRLDILVNNAGALRWSPIEQTSMREYELVHSINARATLAAMCTAIPHMLEARERASWRPPAHIVNMAPPISSDALVGRVAYGMSKFGMTLAALGAGEELRGRGVCVNALWPRTLIETQAVIRNGIGERKDWRSPQIVADAVVELVRSDLTARAWLDEEVLRELAGVSNFNGYRCLADHEPPAAWPPRLR